MALWEAYFDESGNDGMSAVFCLGGYLMVSGAARQMEIEWRKALKQAGVSYFHMVDVAHGNGEFRWVPRTARVGLQTKCIELIKQYALVGECFFFNPQRFKNPSAIKVFDDVYFHAIAHCIMRMCNLAIAKDPDARLHLFFESGHASERLARAKIGTHFLNLDSWLPNGGPSITYADKRDVALLQCGDLLAWQAAKYVKDVATGERPPRNDFRSLMRMTHFFYYIHSENEEFSISRQVFIPEMDWEKKYGSTLHEYIKALFGVGQAADDKLREVHAQFDQNQPHDRSEALNIIFGGRW